MIYLIPLSAYAWQGGGDDSVSWMWMKELIKQFSHKHASRGKNTERVYKYLLLAYLLTTGSEHGLLPKGKDGLTAPDQFAVSIFQASSLPEFRCQKHQDGEYLQAAEQHGKSGNQLAGVAYRGEAG